LKEFALALPKIGMQFLRRSGHRQLSIPDLPLDTNVSRGFSFVVFIYKFESLILYSCKRVCDIYFIGIFVGW